MENTKPKPTASLTDSLNRLVHVYENRDWVKCPACSEEWSKLYPCVFWKEVGEKWEHAQSHICLDCATTPRSFQWIATNWPRTEFDNWGTPTIKMGWTRGARITSKCYDDTVVNWQARLAKVWIVNRDNEQPEFIVMANGNPGKPIDVFVRGHGKKSFDNIIAAWFAMNRIAQGKDDRD